MMDIRTRKVRPRPKCSCPIYCTYCGAKRRVDRVVGHYCTTTNCPWRRGYQGCALAARGLSPQGIIALDQSGEPGETPKSGSPERGEM